MHKVMPADGAAGKTHQIFNKYLSLVMNWTSYINGFKAYLKLEKSLSANTIQAYLNDMGKFTVSRGTPEQGLPCRYNDR